MSNSTIWCSVTKNFMMCCQVSVIYHINKTRKSMGISYRMTCESCGYTFFFFFLFGGFSDRDRIEQTRAQFREGRADSELQGIYDALKQSANTEDKKAGQSDNYPKIEDLTALYYCSTCKDYFNGNYVIIHGRRGTFTEESIPCPVCGNRYAFHIPEKEMISGAGNNCESKSARRTWIRCPRCNDHLTITLEAIYD